MAPARPWVHRILPLMIVVVIGGVALFLAALALLTLLFGDPVDPSPGTG